MPLSSATIVAHGLVGALEVDAGLREERPGLDVLAVLGADVVRQAAALAHLGEEARRHAAAEHGREHRRGVAVGVQQRQAVAADADVERVRLLVVDAHARMRLGRPRLGLGALGGRQRAEERLARTPRAASVTAPPRPITVRDGTYQRPRWRMNVSRVAAPTVSCVPMMSRPSGVSP